MSTSLVEEIQGTDDIFSELTTENIEAYAMSAYNNPVCTSLDDFYEDFGLFVHLKRLLARKINGHAVQERLILNRVIMISNVFGIKATVRMLMFNISVDQAQMLKTIFVFLNYVKITDYDDIPIDHTLLNKLNNVCNNS